MAKKITDKVIRDLIMEVMNERVISEVTQVPDLPFKQLSQFTSTSPIFKFDIFVKGDIATSMGGQRTSTAGFDTQQKIISEFSNGLPGNTPLEKLKSLINIFNDPLANLGQINDINGDKQINGIDKISVFFRTYVIYNFLRHLSRSNAQSMGFALENWIAIVMGGTAMQFVAGGAAEDVEVGEHAYSLKYVTSGEKTARISQSISSDDLETVFDYIIVNKDAANPSVIEFVHAPIKGKEINTGLDTVYLKTKAQLQQLGASGVEQYLADMEKYKADVLASQKDTVTFTSGGVTYTMSVNDAHAFSRAKSKGGKEYASLKRSDADTKRLKPSKDRTKKAKAAIKGKPETKIKKPNQADYEIIPADIKRFQKVSARLADPEISEPVTIGTINIPEFLQKIDTIVSNSATGPDAQIISYVKSLTDSMEQLKVYLTLWWLNATGDKDEKQRATVAAADVKKSAENCKFLINKVSTLDQLPESTVEAPDISANKDLVTRMDLPDIKINQIAEQDLGSGVISDTALTEIASKINVPNASDPDKYIVGFVNELINFFNSEFSDSGSTTDISEVFAKVMMLQSFLFLFDLKVSDPQVSGFGAMAGAVGGTTAGFMLESLFNLMFADGKNTDFIAKTIGGTDHKTDFAVYQKSTNTLYSYSSKLRDKPEDFKDSGAQTIKWDSIAKLFGIKGRYKKVDNLIGFSAATEGQSQSGKMTLHIGKRVSGTTPIPAPVKAEFEFGAANFNSFMENLESSLNTTKTDFLESFEKLNIFKIRTAEFLSEPNSASFGTSLGSYNSFKQDTNELFSEFGEQQQIAEIVTIAMLQKLISESFKK